jgi:hypothetical protein
MRIGVSLTDPDGPDPLTALRDEISQAAGDGFTSAWISNIFGRGTRRPWPSRPSPRRSPWAAGSRSASACRTGS